MITSQTYWIALIAFLVVLNIAVYVIGKRRNSNLRYIGLILSLIIAVTNKWIFPNVYTVKGCGSYDHHILLMPKTVNGFAMSLGKHCYVLNQSPKTLTEETLIYGNTDKVADAPRTIPAGQSRELPFVGIDYLFTTPPTTVRTKSSYERKHALYCGEPQTETQPGGDFAPAD